MSEAAFSIGWAGLTLACVISALIGAGAMLFGLCWLACWLYGKAVRR